MAKKRTKRIGRSLNARFNGLDPELKAAIALDAEDIVRGAFRGKLAGGCLYWTGALLIAAGARGLDLRLQAGTMMWRRLPEALDDGVADTHFSYVWEGMNHPSTRVQLANGGLPEMHVWAADPQRKEIVDLTTRFLPERCEATTGMPWLDAAPPEYIWTSAKGLHVYDCVYRADVDACKLADALLRKEFARAGLL